MEGLSEMGLSKPVVRSVTKWAALLRRLRGLPMSNCVAYISLIKIKIDSHHSLLITHIPIFGCANLLWNRHMDMRFDPLSCFRLFSSPASLVVQVSTQSKAGSFLQKKSEVKATAFSKLVGASSHQIWL